MKQGEMNLEHSQHAATLNLFSNFSTQWDGSFEHPKHMLKLMDKKIFTFLRSLNICGQNYRHINMNNQLFLSMIYTKQVGAQTDTART